MLVDVSSFISVSEVHVMERRVGPTQESEAASEGPIPPLIRIASSAGHPGEPFTAVPYRGHWFSIDDRDMSSKRLFTFLMFIFTLVETGGREGAPVLTIRRSEMVEGWTQEGTSSAATPARPARSATRMRPRTMSARGKAPRSTTLRIGSRNVPPRQRAARRRLGLVVALTLFAGLGVVEATAQPPTTPKPAPPIPIPHDPLLGMEPSGRIPKVPFPEDLPKPERWRYLPEGRIKPGNLFERLLVTSFIAPQIFFEESVGIGGGIVLTDIDFRNQRRQEFLGAFLSYTTEGQQSYRVIWRRWLYHRELDTGGVLLEERSFVDGFGGYRKTLTRRFFGLGADTRPSAESSYTDEVVYLNLRADLSLPSAGSDWVASFGLRGEHHNLSRGRVEDVPSTDDAFPDLFQDADGRDTLSFIGGIRYDTRDSQHQPYAGWRVGLAVEAPFYQSTGEPGAVFTAYANVALALPPLFHRGGDRRLEENPPTDTLALGLFVQESVGDLAYYDLPSLGGTQTLRGYIASRFTGEAAWHAAAEYRFWVIPRGFAITRAIRIERIGLALFAEAGTVGDSVADLPAARVHTSYGAGLRVGLERTAMLRADLGFSGEGPNFVLSFGLPF